MLSAGASPPAYAARDISGGNAISDFRTALDLAAERTGVRHDPLGEEAHRDQLGIKEGGVALACRLQFGKGQAIRALADQLG